jgi:hypothetical protein
MADGTPIIAVPERTGSRQTIDNPASSQHKPAASQPPVRAEQVPN